MNSPERRCGPDVSTLRIALRDGGGRQHEQSLRRQAGTLQNMAKTSPRRTILLLLIVILTFLSNVLLPAHAKPVSQGVVVRSSAAIIDRFSLVYPATQVFRGASVQFPFLTLRAVQGIEMVRNGSAGWAVVTLPLKEADIQAGVRLVPLYVGAVVIVYNFPKAIQNSGLPPLNISQDALVGIFDGSIKSWNDTRITSSNPALRAFSTQLNVPPIVVAPNESEWGPTWQLSAALSSMSPTWNSTIGKTPNSKNFPGVTNAVPATDMPHEILSAPFSIGYTDLYTAKQYNLDIAKIENAEGYFREANRTTLNASAEWAAPELYQANPDHPWVVLGNAGGAGSYPIAFITQMLLRNGNPADCIEAYEIARFAYWMITDQEAADIAVSLGSMRPPSFTDFSLQMLGNYKCANGVYLLKQVIEDIAQEKTDTTYKVFLIAVSVMGGLVVLLGVSMCGAWAWQQRKRTQKVLKGNSKLVDIPNDVSERSQKELNRKVNAPVMDSEKPPAKDDDDSIFEYAGLSPHATQVWPIGTNPVYQAKLIKSSTGALRAVVGPVNYQVEIWKPENTDLLKAQPKDAITGLVTDSMVRIAGRRNSLKGTKALNTGPPEIQVATPITVKPKWQKDIRVHIAFVLFRVVMDAVALALNWITLRSFPPGTAMVIVYAALCVIGSLFFIANLILAFFGIYLQDDRKIEIDVAALKGRSKVSTDMLAYIKSEIRRLYIVCLRELIYRVSMLVREIPLIIVAILIASDAKFIEPIVLLSLCANGIGFGFKARSIPMTLEEFTAYFDMREMYRLLRATKRGLVSAASDPDSHWGLGMPGQEDEDAERVNDEVGMHEQMEDVTLSRPGNNLIYDDDNRSSADYSYPVASADQDQYSNEQAGTQLTGVTLPPNPDLPSPYPDIPANYRRGRSLGRTTAVAPVFSAPPYQNPSSSAASSPNPKPETLSVPPPTVTPPQMPPPAVTASPAKTSNLLVPMATAASFAGQTQKHPVRRVSMTNGGDRVQPPPLAPSETATSYIYGTIPRGRALKLVNHSEDEEEGYQPPSRTVLTNMKDKLDDLLREFEDARAESASLRSEVTSSSYAAPQLAVPNSRAIQGTWVSYNGTPSAPMAPMRRYY